MAKEKKMSLDELARMVARGVENQATKIDLERVAVTLREEVKEGFERVELHISSLGSDWKERFDALEMRVRKLEHKIR